MYKINTYIITRKTTPLMAAEFSGDIVYSGFNPTISKAMKSRL